MSMSKIQIVFDGRDAFCLKFDIFFNFSIIIFFKLFLYNDCKSRVFCDLHRGAGHGPAVPPRSYISYYCRPRQPTFIS